MPTDDESVLERRLLHCSPVPVGDDESNYDTLYDDIDECEEDEGDYDNVESEDEDEDEDEEEEDSRAVKSCSWMFSSGKEEISGEVEEEQGRE